MIAGAAPDLTERQRAVMQRIDRRMPIKLIASELGVSETRINQHIRALKKMYGAASLNELVECHRQHPEGNGDEDAGSAPKVMEIAGDDIKAAPFRNPAYSKKQLNLSDFIRDQSNRDDPGSIRVSDAHVVARDAHWAHDIEPVVVFGALDGKNAVLYRFAAMIGIAFGMIAAVVLVVSAAVALSEVLDGKAAVPVDNEGVVR